MSKYNVLICSEDNDEVVEVIKCGGYREAERVERGVNINLSDKYYTYIEDDETTKKYESQQEEQ